MDFEAHSFLTALVDRGLFQTWARHRPEGWRLASGQWSPFYLQLRRLPSHPDLLRQVGQGLADLLQAEMPDITRLIGIAMAGVPIAAAVGLEAGLPFGFTRKMEGVKSAAEFRSRLASYGDHRLVEADLADGDRIVLVDDLLTGFTSKQVALAQVEEEARRRGISLKVDGIAVIIIRGAEGKSLAEEAGFRITSLIELSPDGIGRLSPILSDLEIKVLSSYLEDPRPFQDPAAREKLIKKR